MTLLNVQAGSARKIRKSISSVIAACGMSALLVSGPAVAADARLDATKTGWGGTFALTWPVPVQVEAVTEAGGRELLMRFSEPLGNVPFARIPEVLGTMVEAVEYGYDSVLIRLAPDVRVEPESTASGIQVALSVSQAGAPVTAGGGIPRHASLTQTEYLYVVALEAAQNKEELVRFWSAKLASGTLSEAEETETVYRLLALGADSQVLPDLESRARELKGSWLYAYADAAERARKQDRLADFLEAELRRRDLSGAEIDERLGLFYARSPQRAISALGARAAEHGGAWAAAHMNALIRSGQDQKLYRFLEAMAADQRLPVSERRAAAFRLLDLGRRQEAQTAYLQIADSQPPGSQDMQQLLFLWGPRPGPAALNWIEVRYTSAKTLEDRRAWIGHLTNLGGAARAAVLLESEEPATLNAMRDQYIAALAASGDTVRLSAAVSAAAATENDIKRLARYAGLAESHRQSTAAEQAWAAILDRDPYHPQALRQAGALAFTAGRLGEAEIYLGRLLRTQRGDFEANHLYAELLTALGKPEDEIYYRQALKRLADQPSRTEASYLAEARIRSRLKDHAGVQTVFENLLQSRPNDTGLISSYADHLIKAGRPDLALDVLKGSTGRHDS